MPSDRGPKKWSTLTRACVTQHTPTYQVCGIWTMPSRVFQLDCFLYATMQQERLDKWLYAIRYVHGALSLDCSLIGRTTYLQRCLKMFLLWHGMLWMQTLILPPLTSAAQILDSSKISNRRFEFETNTPCFSIESDIRISTLNSKLSISTLYRSRTECYCLFSLPYLAGI